MPMTLIRSTNNSDWLFDTILPIALCCHTHANSLPILLLSARLYPLIIHWPSDLSERLHSDDLGRVGMVAVTRI